jgi:hypothetical protein
MDRPHGEFAKDLALRQKAQRMQALTQRIEEARADALVTSLAFAHDGVEARVELRSNVEMPLIAAR